MPRPSGEAFRIAGHGSLPCYVIGPSKARDGWLRVLNRTPRGWAKKPIEVREDCVFASRAEATQQWRLACADERAGVQTLHERIWGAPR